MKWASYAVVLTALWLVASPWALDYRDRTATAEDLIVGGAIWATAMFAAVNDGDHLHWLIIALASWLVAAPWILGYMYVSAAVTNDAAAGVLIMTCTIIRWAAIRAGNRSSRQI